MVKQKERPATFVGKVSKNAWRLFIAAAGSSLLAAGAMLLFLPGPGLVVLLFGLAVLATEFVWARTLLNGVTARIKRGKDRVRATFKGDRKDTDNGNVSSSDL
jgi:hypothetical protein